MAGAGGATTPLGSPPADAARILFVWSAPLGYLDGRGEFKEMDALNIQEERRRLRKTIRQASNDLGIAVRWAEEVASVLKFSPALRKGCTVLHFTGHGLPARAGIPPRLTFEDEWGMMHAIKGSQLRDIFEKNMGHSSVRCVFVSACHSEDVGKAFAEAGVPHVIAVKTSTEIQDKASILFAQQFYDALLNGDTVQGAFDDAKMAVQRSGGMDGRDVEVEKFKLFGSGDASTAALFKEAPPGRFVEDPRKIAYHGHDPVQNLTGRGKDVFTVLKRLGPRFPCVTVCGMAGLGKTQVVRKAGSFAAERGIFAVVYSVILQKGDVTAGWDGLTRRFAAAYGKEVTVESFEEDLRNMFGPAADGPFLTIVDGADLYGLASGHDEEVLRRFLCRVASCTCDMRFLLAKSTKLGASGDLPESCVTIKPLPDIATAELLARSMTRNWFTSEVDLSDVAVPQHHKSFRREFIRALSMHPAVKALKGHPASTMDLARRLSEDAPGRDRNLRLSDPECVDTIVPKIREKYTASTGRVIFGGGMRGPPRAPEATSAASATPDVEAVRNVIKDAEGVQFWVAAATACAKKAAGALLRQETADDSAISSKTEYGMLGTWDGEADGAGGAGDSKGSDVPLRTAEETVAEAEARASMPPPIRPVAGHTKSTPLGRPRPGGIGLKHQGVSYAPTDKVQEAKAKQAQAKSEALKVDYMQPITWESVCDELKATFQRRSPEAAASRQLSDAEFKWMKASRKLNMANHEGKVAITDFAARWPVIKEWLLVLSTVADDWAITSPAPRINGWMSRDETNAILKWSPAGTFVVRFSDSTPSQLVIGVVLKNPANPSALQTTQIKLAIIGTEPGADTKYKVAVQLQDPTRGRFWQVYEGFTLSDFILNYADCLYLHPAWPKHAVYAPSKSAAAP